MSDQEYNFQKDLENSILNADPKIDRKELLIDIFKSYVAKMFEFTLTKKGLPYEALVEVKNNLISEFRRAELSERQMSVEQYEALFDSTVQEILAFAASQHQGRDSVSMGNQSLQINPEAYINEGGLYVPPHLARH